MLVVRINDSLYTFHCTAMSHEKQFMMNKGAHDCREYITLVDPIVRPDSEPEPEQVVIVPAHSCLAIGQRTSIACYGPQLGLEHCHSRGNIGESQRNLDMIIKLI